MFKVGDRVKIKDDVVDIINARNKDGMNTIEFDHIASTYAGESSIVEGISGNGTYKVFGWFWGWYSLEYDYNNSIKGYALLV